MIKRNITLHLKKMLSQFKIVSLTGPRQSGKTTLLRSEFPNYKYYNLERIDHREMILSDPVGFLKDKGSKIIFDEVQNAPDLFSYIQVFCDDKDETGQYILSGSQSFLLNERISQSLAGRLSVNNLFPFDITEMHPSQFINWHKVIFNGFYPGIYDKNIAPNNFYPSYIQTYIDRDVRTLKNIGDLSSFSRFLKLCAGRVGQVLNITSLANDTGVSVNTAKSWLSILQASYIIFLIQPYYNNFSKRLIKSPKLYFYDMGVVASLLNIQHEDDIKTHYLYGSLFENLVISELIKVNHHNGKNSQIYYWRESNGTEIDCIIEQANQNLLAIEIKAGQTYNKDFIKNIKNFAKLTKKVKKILIYGGSESMNLSDITIISWDDFYKRINDLFIKNLTST